MNAAKVTLTSTILAAALGLAFGLMSTPAQAHTTACLTKPDHKHCPDGGAIEYAVKLTTEAFVFAPVNPVPVTPNQRENVLRSVTDLDMVRPDIDDDPVGYDTWNAVFNACEEMLGEDTVDAFSVGHTDWSVDKAGGVRVVFRNALLRDTKGYQLGPEGAEFRVQLIGDEFDFDVPFLPDPREMSVFELVDFAITGTPQRGKGAIKSCRGSAGSGELGFIDGSNNFIPSPSTLEITASDPDS